MKEFDTVIVGAGTAGITAAIYLARSGRSVALIEKGLYGGMLYNTDSVENFTSYSGISGYKLAELMEDHVRSVKGIEHIYGEVVNVIKGDDETFLVNINGSSMIKSKTLVVATGVQYKKTGLDTENEYSFGKGISNCATCDGNFFKGENVAVLGGGDSAAESALYLSNVANKVYLVHRRDKLRAEKVLQNQINEKDNIEIIWSAEATSFSGVDSLERISYLDKISGEEKEVEVRGAFINIGIVPVSEQFKQFGIVGSDGFIQVDQTMAATGHNNLFAIGDVRSGSSRQLMTAAADGVIVSASINNYLSEI